MSIGQPTLHLSHKHGLRFQRWSRKRAATFHSLRQEVTIGCLRANVVERLLLKTNYLPSSHRGDREQEIFHLKEPDDPEYLLNDEMLRALVTKQSLDISHACSTIEEAGEDVFYCHLTDGLYPERQQALIMDRYHRSFYTPSSSDYLL